jgi:DNA-binding NarL/FixJ family response regulator
MDTPSVQDSRLLVHVIARDQGARERLSSIIADNPRLCVVSSALPSSAAPSNHDPAPDVIVAYANSFDDCRNVHELADRHPDAFAVLIVSDVDWPPESLDTSNVNHIHRGRPDVIHETLTSLLDGHAQGRDAKAAPAPSVSAVDRDRLARLTQREREILTLTAEGLSIEEIAERLHRAFATVAKHRNNIMTKTGLRDRVALTRFAIRVGLASA